MYPRKIFVLVLLLLTSCLADNKKPELKKNPHAEKFIKQFVQGVKGIERYYLLISIDNQSVSLSKIESLLKYHKEKVPNALKRLQQSVAPAQMVFNINKINKRAGYMSTQCAGCEVSNRYVYWSINKATKLMGIVSSTCGPICESSLMFVKFNGDQQVDAKIEDYASQITPKFFLKDKTNTAYLEQDAWEVSITLPEVGTDILFKLDNVNNKEVFQGNCIKLLWQKPLGTFKLGPLQWCS